MKYHQNEAAKQGDGQSERQDVQGDDTPDPGPCSLQQGRSGKLDCCIVLAHPVLCQGLQDLLQWRGKSGKPKLTSIMLKVLS